MTAFRPWPALLALLFPIGCGGSPPVPEAPPAPRGPLAPPPAEIRPEEPGSASRPAAPLSAVSGSQALRLPTGLGLVLQTDPGQPGAAVALSLTPSALATPTWLSALACLGLVSGGTTRLPERAFLDEIERLGGRLETSWRQGSLLLRLECPAAGLEGCLALLLELILFPAYPEETLEAALGRGASLFDGRPAWTSLAGDGPPPAEDLPSRPEELPSAARMRRWHAAAFQPGAAHLALLSPLPLQATLEILSRTLARWQGEAPPLAGQVVAAEPGLYWTDAPEGASATLTVLVPLGSPWAETWPGRRVQARLLAGLGARGPLPAALQAAGLARKPLDVRWTPWPGGAVAVAFSLPGLDPSQLAPALTALAESLRESGAHSPDPLELAAASAGAWCEESLLLHQPWPALERGLTLAAQNEAPLLDGPLALPVAALTQVGPQLLAGASGTFRPDRIRVHIEAPAALRADPRFEDARLLPRPITPFASESALAAAPTPAEEARGRELLALAIRALGGSDALDRLKGVHLSGTVRWELGPEVIEEWGIEVGRLKRGRTLLGIRVDTLLEEGTEGHSKCGDEQLSLPPDAAAHLRRDLAGNLLWLLARFDRQTGAVAAVGQESWEGLTLERVRLGRPETDAPILAIDPLSGLPRILHHPGRGRLRDVLLDFRDQGVLRHPHRVERWRRAERLWVLHVDEVRMDA